MSISENKTPKEVALQFVDLLTPGNFNKAKELLSDDCEYVYGDSVLTGDAIINSFEENHRNAHKKLDSIKYLKGIVELVEGNKVSVLVQDQITVNGKSHVYTDRLIVTLTSPSETRPVIRIENKRVDGERDRLLIFFESCGIEWK